MWPIFTLLPPRFKNPSYVPVVICVHISVAVRSTYNSYYTSILYRHVYTSMHQVPNPDSNLDHNPHGRGGLSLDLNPVCLRVNATNLHLDQNSRVNGA